VNHSHARTAMLVLASVLLVTAPSSRAEVAPSPKWQEANDAYQKGDWKKAAEAYSAITKTEPKSGRAWYRLGASRAHLGKLEEAIASYVKADELTNRENPRISYDLACAFARRGDQAQALAWLDKAVARGFRLSETMKKDEDLASLRGSDRFAAILQQVERNDHPCAYAAENRQFDFWIGDWQVSTLEGNTAGHNTITRENGDCWIHESWKSAISGTGQSFNFYNKTTKKWHQTWVDDQGDIAEYDGNFESGAMRFEGYRQGPNGTRVPARLTFTPLPDGRVRQLGEASTDGGKTWTVEYDFYYARQEAAAATGGK